MRITGYSIGWVQNCDTFNQLITDYRKSKGLRVGIELGLLQNKSLNFDMGVSKNPMKNSLTIMQKIEIFEDVLEETTGQDLAQMYNLLLISYFNIYSSVTTGCG